MSFRWLLASLLIGSVLAADGLPREEVCGDLDSLNITKAFIAGTDIFFGKTLKEGGDDYFPRLIIDKDLYLEAQYLNKDIFPDTGILKAAVHFGKTKTCDGSEGLGSDPSTNTSVRAMNSNSSTSNPGADPDTGGPSDDTTVAGDDSTSVPPDGDSSDDPGGDPNGAEAECKSNRNQADNLVLVVYQKALEKDQIGYKAYNLQPGGDRGVFFSRRDGEMPWGLKNEGLLQGASFWVESEMANEINRVEYMAMTFLEQAMTLYVSVLEYRGEPTPTPALYHKKMDKETRKFGKWERRDNTSYSYAGLIDYGGRLFGILANKTVVEIDRERLHIIAVIPIKQFFGCNGTDDNPGWVSPFEWGKELNKSEVQPDLVPPTSAPDTVTADTEQIETTTTPPTKPSAKSSAWIIFLIIAIIIIIIVILVIVCLCCGKKSEDAKAADGQKGGAGGAQAAQGQTAEGADAAGPAKSGTGAAKSGTGAAGSADTSSQDSKALAGVSKSDSSIKSTGSEDVSIRSKIE